MLSIIQGEQHGFNRLWIRLKVLGEMLRVFTLKRSYMELSAF